MKPDSAKDTDAGRPGGYDAAMRAPPTTTRGRDAAPSPPPTARVAVLLPLPVDAAYDYALPEGVAAPPGRFVRVPFRGREATGVVWGDGLGGVADTRLKAVAAVLDAPPMAAPP